MTRTDPVPAFFVKHWRMIAVTASLVAGWYELRGQIAAKAPIEQVAEIKIGVRDVSMEVKQLRAQQAGTDSLVRIILCRQSPNDSRCQR